MYSWWQSRPAENPSNVGHCSQINDLAPVAMPQCFWLNILFMENTLENLVAVLPTKYSWNIMKSKSCLSAAGEIFLEKLICTPTCPGAAGKIFLENLVCTPTCPSAAGRYSWNIVSTRQHTATQNWPLSPFCIVLLC